VAPPERKSQSTVKDRLFKETHRYSFFQTVRLLEAFSPEKKQLGASAEPEKETIRFSVKPGLAFPPSDIVKLEARGDEEPSLVEIAFMGLVGPNGVLPHWYNELAIEQNRKHDTSLTAFLDLFQHRLITLLYLAWKKNQFPVNFLPGAKDKLSGYLLSLCGLGTGGLSHRIGFAEESLCYYSGLLSRQVPSGASIRSTVEHFTGQKTVIDQFVQRMILLAEEDMTQVGKANAKLGVDVICGSHIWECQTKFMLTLGPMTLVDFKRFLPSGDMHKPTFALVRYVVGIEYEFDIKIVLKRQEVPPCILGEESSRLGWSIWLKSQNIMMKDDPSVTFSEAEVTV
jgi:type VI secretion system protein ImpH